MSVPRVIAWVAALGGLVACSSNSNGNTSSQDAGTKDSTSPSVDARAVDAATDAHKQADAPQVNGDAGHDVAMSARDTGTPVDGGGAVDSSQPETAAPGISCVSAEAGANEAGLGGYCSTTVPCPGSALCTANFGAPSGQWFCTTVCTTNEQCGPGMACNVTTGGKGCAPCACRDIQDGGLDFLDGGCSSSTRDGGETG